MLLTVVLLTKRWGSLDVWADSLTRQTVWPQLVAERNVEVLLIDEHARDPRRQAAAQEFSHQLGDEIDLTLAYPPDYAEQRYCKIARGNSLALQLARGDYIAFVNDFISIPDNTLERLLQENAKQPNALLTCVCHHAAIPPVEHIADPQGAFTIFKEPFRAVDWNIGPDTPTSWRDPRVDDPEHTLPLYAWEASVAMARTEMLRQAGGWCEDFDLGIGADQVTVTLDVLTKIPNSGVVLLNDVVGYSCNHDVLIPDIARKEAEKRNGKRLGTYVQHARLTRNIPVQMPPESQPTIAFWLPTLGAWSDIDPLHPLAHPLGGRETAVLRIAQEMAALRWHVALYTKTTVPTFYGEGIVWAQADPAYLPSLSRYDVVVAVDDASIFHTVRARLNVLHHQYAAPATPIGRLGRKIDAHMLLSTFQRESLQAADQGVDPDKCVVLSNGLDLARYDDIPLDDAPTIPGRLVWSSSPDRGLHHLLRIWPLLKAQHPHLSLDVYYNVDAMFQAKWLHALPAEMAKQIDEGRTLPGVRYIGAVDQATLARAQRQAELFVYPCDCITPTETYCITALEAAAARVPMLLSTADCLPEVYGKIAYFGALPIQDEAWMQAINRLLTEPALRSANIDAARAFAEEHTWAKVAALWSTFLTLRLKVPTGSEEAIALAENISAGIAPLVSPVPAVVG